jgi:hypothetical protein
MSLGILARERTIAPPGWSRWLIPPAALSVHLAIGQAYAWSVFKKPLEATMLTDSSHPGTLSALPFQLGIVMLGLSAALFGKTTLKDGVAQEKNFNTYRVLRIDEAPHVETYIVPSTNPPSGVGEPGVPLMAPIVASAVMQFTGKPVSALPIVNA